MWWEIKDLAGLDTTVGVCLVLAPVFPPVTVRGKIQSLPWGAATCITVPCDNFYSSREGSD